jgi:hypothetical protein
VTRRRPGVTAGTVASLSDLLALRLSHGASNFELQVEVGAAAAIATAAVFSLEACHCLTWKYSSLRLADSAAAPESPTICSALARRPAPGPRRGRGPGLASGSAEKMNIQVRDAKVSDVEMVQKIYSHHVLHGTGLILRQYFP